MSGIIFFICSILAISALFAAQKFHLHQLHYDGEKNSGTKRRRKGCVKSRPAVMNISSQLVTSSAASSPIASKNPGMSGASGRPGSRMNLEASSFDAASASQVRLKVAYLGGLKEEQQGDLSHEKEENSEETDDSESEPWYYKPVAQTNEACGKSLAGETAESISQTFQKSQSNKEATLKHFLAISPHTLPYVNAVYDMVRKVYERPAGDPVDDLDVNVAIWGIFMNATLRAATHLGNDHDVNLRNVKNSSWRSTGELFGYIEKFISGQTETASINLIDSKDLRWLSTSLLHSRAYQYANAKVYVFSDSVLCLERMGNDPIGSWKNKIQWNSDTNF